MEEQGAQLEKEFGDVTIKLGLLQKIELGLSLTLLLFSRDLAKMRMDTVTQLLQWQRLLSSQTLLCFT